MLAPRCRFVILQGALRARLRVTGSDRFRRMIDQRRFKIGAGLGYDLLAEFGAQRLRLDLLNVALIEIAQLERPERHADEPVHLEVERLQDLAHLAVLAFADADGEPDIGALFTVERRFDRPIMHARDRDAGAQPVERRLHHAPQSAHAIAPQPAGRRQFEHARQTAVIGEQQQPFGVDVEPADADQPRQILGQRGEDGRASLRVGIRGHQAARLVIAEQPRALAGTQRLAVHRDAVGRRDVERGRGNHRPIDGHAPSGDPGLGLAPRGQPRPRHDLGDAFAEILLIALVGHAHSRNKVGRNKVAA